MTKFAGIAKFERDLIRERTSAGRQVARRRGIHFGRARKLQPRANKLGAAADKPGEIRQGDRRHLQRPHRNHLSALTDGGLSVFAVPLLPNTQVRVHDPSAQVRDRWREFLGDRAQIVDARLQQKGCHFAIEIASTSLILSA
jgi:hypothetical protein